MHYGRWKAIEKSKIVNVKQEIEKYFQIYSNIGGSFIDLIIPVVPSYVAGAYSV